MKHLRGVIRWQIERTWYWQDQLGVGRTPSAHSERHVKALGYLRWDLGLWARRRVRAKHRFLTHPPIPHMRLWLCIHAGEGAWNDPDSGHSGHWGGLQMTSPWGRGVYYVYRADWLTPYQQMRKAELGYAASGYSRTWLLSQWYHPECVGFA